MGGSRFYARCTHYSFFFWGGDGPHCIKLKMGVSAYAKRGSPLPPSILAHFILHHTYLMLYCLDGLIGGLIKWSVTRWFNRRPYKVVCHQMV